MEGGSSTEHNANAFYRAGGNATKASSVDGAVAVPSFQLYKVMRAEELACYRSLLRVMAMHQGSKSGSDRSDAELPKHQRRLLEDVQELCSISTERHQLEMAEMRDDSVVAAIRKSGVVSDRAPYFDGVHDLPKPLPADDEDDGGSVVAIAAPTAAGGGSAAAGRPSRKTTKKPQGRPGTPAQHLLATSPSSLIQKEVKAMGEEIKSLCKELVCTSSPSDRNELKQQLAERQRRLEELRAQRIAELQGSAPAPA